MQGVLNPRLLKPLSNKKRDFVGAHIYVDISFINLRKIPGFIFKDNSSTCDIGLRLFTDTLYSPEEIATIIDISSWSNKIINEQILLLIIVLSKHAMQYSRLLYLLHKHTNAFGLRNLL